MDTHATAITVKSAHLNDWMPVGDRFPGTREHFTPVVSTQAVCIIANSTHSNDFIMADAVSVQEGESEKKTCDHNSPMCSKNNNAPHREREKWSALTIHVTEAENHT